MRGFARVSAAVPRVHVAGWRENLESIKELLDQAEQVGSQVVVFPELCLTSYTARDLFFDAVLLEGALAALRELVATSAALKALFFVGLPFRFNSGIYNVAAAIQGGRLLGLVPKTYLPNYREFEERRWFRPGSELEAGTTVEVEGQLVPFGTDLIFGSRDTSGLRVGVEICEDLWVQAPPHIALVSAGATLIANLSASNYLVGKADLRKMLSQSASDRGKCAYVYVAAGPSESSTDMAFDGHAFVYENGSLLAESERFQRKSTLLTTDVDLHQLEHEREVTGTFGDCARASAGRFRSVSFTGAAPAELMREINRHPFVPKNSASLAARCWEVLEIQTHALATRLERTAPGSKLVLGLSGGLDSTHAALVCVSALDLLERPRTDLLCLTMPGFGSSDATQSNAGILARALGATAKQVSVAELSRGVLDELGHPSAGGTVEELLARVRADPRLADVGFENVQARLRTLLLMTQANTERGIVVGTGDLSEKALGWSTYAGDQISMYDVNAGVPKTLIQFLIRWVANERVTTWSKGDPDALRAVLFEILSTPISPELLPPDEEGKIAQLTEAQLGPYELHDFFLFHWLRYGRRPSDIAALAELAFEGSYDANQIRHWLKVFLERFFRNQFKRSCTPDAPKVGMVALSPRADWRMPSDAMVQAWLEELG
jgi:NAD+ synthase (glutamine-hydrolysing)